MRSESCRARNGQMQEEPTTQLTNTPVCPQLCYWLDGKMSYRREIKEHAGAAGAFTWVSKGSE